MAQAIEHLFSKCETQSSNPSTTKKRRKKKKKLTSHLLEQNEPDPQVSKLDLQNQFIFFRDVFRQYMSSHPL
jgi:hypothetical protein